MTAVFKIRIVQNKAFSYKHIALFFSYKTAEAHGSIVCTRFVKADKVGAVFFYIYDISFFFTLTRKTAVCRVYDDIYYIFTA